MNKHKRLSLSDKFAFSMNEAEHVSGLSRTNLYQLIAEGKLKSVKVGGRRLVPASSLRELLSPEAV